VAAVVELLSSPMPAILARAPASTTNARLPSWRHTPLEGDTTVGMIVIQGTIVINPEKRDKTIEACNTMRAATIVEDGCLGYRFGFATDDPDVLMVAEQWESGDALVPHMASAHMAAFGAAIGEIVGGLVDVTRFEIASSGPLGS
jgi:quinol monooxygenase YgiN